MKLESIKTISGTIRLLTGLHIGASKDTIEIGGLDQPIVKHPITGEPYIPGSSIKGKMRSLVELTFFPEKVSDGKPCSCGEKDCPVCVIFGTSGSEKSEELGPTRLMVRDAFLTEEWKGKFESGDLPMEEKYENTIDRLKGTAEHPRPLERVPAGVEFNFNLSFKVFEGDDEDKLLDYVKKGLRLIELDALGGQSSRGSGQIQFVEMNIDSEPFNLPEEIF